MIITDSNHNSLKNCFLVLNVFLLNHSGLSWLDVLLFHSRYLCFFLIYFCMILFNYNEIILILNAHFLFWTPPLRHLSVFWHPLLFLLHVGLRLSSCFFCKGQIIYLENIFNYEMHLDSDMSRRVFFFKH